MRRSLGLIFLVLVTGASSLQAQSKDERAVRALLDRVIQAGNSVDEKVVKQIYAEYSRTAGPFYPPIGTSLASQADAEAYTAEFLKQVSARSFEPTSPITLRVDRTLAWAAFTWRASVTFKDGTRQDLEGRSSITFVREGKNWKIAHGHSSVPAVLPPTASARQAEAQAILQIERAAWDAFKNKQADFFATYLADDASYFDEEQAYRVRGKGEILHQIDEAMQDLTLRSWQLLDPQVEVLGDTAVLTYYFTESGTSGYEEFTHAGKLTVVLVKRDGAWRMLHAHRSLNR